VATNTVGIEDFGLFSDEVYTSTDLNRHDGEVLDHARTRPITISRNREQFALLKRDHVAKLIQALLQFGPTLKLVQGAWCAVEGKEIPSDVAWIKAFDNDDIRKMVGQVIEASVTALHDTGDWDKVGAIIHEWHESALVTMSGILDEALRSQANESPLPDPRPTKVEEFGDSR